MRANIDFHSLCITRRRALTLWRRSCPNPSERNSWRGPAYAQADH